MRKHPIFCWLFAIVCLLVSLSHAHADEKLPVPSEKEQAEVVELLKEIYGDQMSSRDADVKKELAKTLLEQAENPSNDAASRYVLLHLAATHAAEAADMDTAMAAISKMERLYRARTSRLRIQILDQAQRASREPHEFASIAKAYAELALIAIQEDNYDVARQAAQKASSTAQRTRDRDFISGFRALATTVREAQRVYQSVESSYNLLASSPDNPEANLAVGRHLAFVKGNWSEGLPHLAKGSDKDIATAAQTDLGSPQEAESQLALGNAWYAIAEKETNEIMKNSIIIRASEYYRSVLPTLDGLLKAQIENRVESAKEIQNLDLRPSSFVIPSRGIECTLYVFRPQEVRLNGEIIESENHANSLHIYKIRLGSGDIIAIKSDGNVAASLVNTTTPELLKGFGGS